VVLSGITYFWSLANLPPPAVYADWCGPCQQVAPLFEQLSQTLSRPNLVTFVKVNTDLQKDVAHAYRVTSMPTFIIFRNAKVADRVQGADPVKLQSIVKKLSDEVENMGGATGEASGSNNGASWRGADLPRGYTDITDQIELQRCELLNVDPGAGKVRALFDTAKPSALSGGNGAAKDWIESDIDPQLLLFMPFQSMLKLHTLQVGYGQPSSIPSLAAT
jgi:thiol-disulfide isomerase/thioredoxin